MKNSILTFAVIGCMAAINIPGCEKSSEQRVKNANENVGDAKQELKSAQAEYLIEWQTFKRESELTIDANEKKIDAFKERMENAGPKTKAKYGKQVAALEQKNSDLKKKLEDYKDEGPSKWQEFKTNFKNDMDGIGKTISDLFNRTD
jgi:predicted  nucleic acid-binding Zn-ribbon protein